MVTPPFQESPMARIVFDLDGTLIDSAEDIRAIANRLLAEEGKPPLSGAEVRSFIGNGVSVLVARMRAARGLPDSAHARMVADFMASYETAVEHTVPYPFVAEALSRLRGAGHRLGICTNKPFAPCRAVLDHVGLAAAFDAVVGGDSLSVLKPDPAPLHAAFEQLGAGPMLYVGDSETDAETARRAHVPFVLFTQGYRKSDLSEIPHAARFDRFADLPGLIETELARA
jgi:phosphoglycolate phosphatase